MVPQIQFVLKVKIDKKILFIAAGNENCSLFHNYDGDSI